MWSRISAGSVGRVGRLARFFESADEATVGAAWGAHIAKVEVRIDDGPWVGARVDRSEEADHAWRIWSLDWDHPAPGEHRITSRAVDFSGNIQPAMDDPVIANKRTYWESNGQVTRHVRVS
jgi:Mo-co oxidoreductase dimerisation domain